MAAPIVVPFNNNPASVINLTSAGYTVPAGKYVNINYTLANGALEINGNAVDSQNCYPLGTYATGSVSTQTTSEITLITATNSTVGGLSVFCSIPLWASGYQGTFRQRRGASIVQTVTLSSSTSAAVTTTFSTFVISGDTFTVQLNSTQPNTARIISLFSETSSFSNAQSRRNDFWLPTGTVINFNSSLPVSVMGVVQIFNQIS